MATFNEPYLRESLMLNLLWFWTFCATASLAAYAAVSFWHDRRFVTSTWINLWLALMVLLGPLGTFFTIRTLTRIINDIRCEVQRLQAAGEAIPQSRLSRPRAGHSPYPQTAASLAGGHD